MMPPRSILLAALVPLTLAAQQATVAPPAGALGKGAETRYGPVVSAAVEIPGEKPATIARAVVSGWRDKEAGFVCFDTERCGVVAAWSGGFLAFERSNLGTYKGVGDGAVVVTGDVFLRNLAAPAWSAAPAFPATQVRYRGFYQSGARTIFSYVVGGVPVLDYPTVVAGGPGSEPTFKRWLAIGPHEGSLYARLASRTLQPSGVYSPDVGRAGGETVRNDDEYVVRFAPLNDWDRFHFLAYKTDAFAGPESLPIWKRDMPDLREWIKGGTPNWPETVTVAGRRAADDAAYVVDTIPLPDDNPWKCWLRPTGLDFLPDGRLAICTLGGDVWIAAGIDGPLAKITWRRFAGGLREPMGLRIVDGKILVGCRDQITRLHDLNGDGEADFYECVNMGRSLVSNFHAFAYDLQMDRAGNFFYGTGGNQLGENEPWHGKVFRVSPDGARLDPIASGFRAPNGITIGPDDSVYVAENQGQWIPSSKISRIRAGRFYGFVADPKAAPKAQAPASFDPPICYLPMAWDNSSGGGVFCDSDQWGPFRGRMLHTSFGAAALFAVFEQRHGEVSQAAVVKFPLPAFESGIHRARFGPDGQLYVCGLKGWQSRAVRDGCLARVRYTGQSVRIPTGFRVEKDAVLIDFAEPLERSAAEDPQNYAVQQWNYKWHATYGSPDISIKHPSKTGRDAVDIGIVRLSPDGRTVRIQINGLAPVMQMLIKANLRSMDGKPLPIEIANTINFIPELGG